MKNMDGDLEQNLDDSGVLLVERSAGWDRWENEWWVTVESQIGWRKRSFSETTERWAEMIKWEEQGAPLRQLQSEAASPCFPQFCLAAGCNPAQSLCQRKPELKKPTPIRMRGMELVLLPEPQYPSAHCSVDIISSVLCGKGIKHCLWFCSSWLPFHSHALISIGLRNDSLPHLSQPPSSRTRS